MRIALAQIQPVDDMEENRRVAVRLMRQAADEKAELIVFPELAFSPFFPQMPGQFEKAAAYAEMIPGPMTVRLAEAARELSLVVVTNLYELDDQGRYFDSSPVIDADGTLLGVTRMVHITDFACFHEREYYHPGDRGAPVYATKAGRVGVAICYDRHFPEYMRALGAAGAQIVVIPQAGTLGEWPPGVFEGEVQVAAFQNGYFAALCNRVGREDALEFCGESFVADPQGKVIFRAPSCQPGLFLAECNLPACETSTARNLFWPDRRPELYREWFGI